MRFVLCLILLLHFALAADAGPFRCSGCSGGSCAVTPSVSANNAKPFSPLDLTMDYRKPERAVLPSHPVVTQPQKACAGGRCGARPANRFGRVTVRMFRR